MIHLCPHCGHNLANSLTDGIAYCGTCGHSVDSSRASRIMSAAWMVYRQNPGTIDRIQRSVGLSDAEAMLVEGFMMMGSYSIDEFRAALLELGVAK